MIISNFPELFKDISQKYQKRRIGWQRCRSFWVIIEATNDRIIVNPAFDPIVVRINVNSDGGVSLSIVTRCTIKIAPIIQSSVSSITSHNSTCISIIPFTWLKYDLIRRLIEFVFSFKIYFFILLIYLIKATVSL